MGARWAAPASRSKQSACTCTELGRHRRRSENVLQGIIQKPCLQNTITKMLWRRHLHTTKTTAWQNSWTAQLGEEHEQCGYGMIRLACDFRGLRI